MMEIARLLASRSIPQNLINFRAKAESDYMSEASQQSVNQNIGTNTGQAQAIAAGRDVNATQQMSQGEVAGAITQEQAVEILSQIEKLIKEADLPPELTSQATKYAGKAKEEASEEKPEQSIIVRHLERATSVIKKADTTAGAAKNLVDKLKPLILKLAGWLGVAANYFLG